MTSRKELDQLSPGEKRALLKQLLERGKPSSPAGTSANVVAGTGPVRRPAHELPRPSSAQERMWFLHQLQPESAAYNVARAVELSGSVDERLLEAALRQLLSRHTALRSVFSSSEGQPRLAFQEVPSRVLESEELSSVAEGEREAVLSRRLREESSRPFSLEQGPLYRFRLLRFSAQRHVFLLVLHHLVVDGWSLNVLMRELGTLYSALAREQVPQLAPLPLEYADFAAWQRTPAATALESSHLEYWKRQLADAPPLLELPTDKPRPTVRTDQGAQTEPLPLPSGLTEAVRALCRERQVTPFMVFQAAFSALLHRYSQQTDLCVGTPVAGRTHLTLEGVVGLFVNTVVLRNTVTPGTPFSELLARARETTLAAYSHQEAPFERVVEALQVERSPGRTPLFQVMFDLYQEERSLTEALAGLGARPVHVDTGTSQFDFALTVIESASGFALSVQYSTELFEDATASRMLSHYVRLLEHAVARPQTTVGELPLLSSAEREQVLYAFNDTERPFDSEATLVSIFEAQVARTPDAPAVVAPEGTLTFRELATQASRLAAHLVAAGARPETVVGLCLARSLDAVVSLLAIFMSGAGCLPLEASHPASRRAALVRQSGARLVVTRPALFAGVELDVPVVSPDVRAREAGPSAPPVPARAEHLAYLLYTSGSTGEPKGVELTHRNVVHCFAAFDPYYETRAGDCWASSGSLSFDIHLEELLFSITRGARTILREVGPLGLGRDIVRHGITHVVIMPSSLATALEEPDALEAFRSLKVLVTGGEVLPEPLVRQLALTRTKLVNTYGPTETSINVVAGRMEPERPVHLGRPLDRCRVYVLDASGEPVPLGVPGELHIGGTPLGRGYRGRPELTAERFVPDPFSREPGARLYRTGDRVRWNPDGTLSFLGRTDFQVKVRGVRVELEEIEAALLRQPGVRQAAVVVRGGGRDTRLDAFLVMEGETSTAAKRLREALRLTLPEAMVPSRFVTLPALPFTTSGKVDRKALAALPLQAPEQTAEGEPPRGPVEELLAQLFRQVLNVEQVRREDDFFQLGGHSLSATRLVARVRQSFGIELPLGAVFAAPSLAAMARELSQRQGSAANLPGPSPRPAGSPPVLSFSQERLWFLQQLQPDSSAYHMAEAVELEGALDSGALEESLRLLLSRHSVLRTTFSAREGHPLPLVRPLPSQVLQHESLAELSAPEALALLQARLRQEVDRPFHLEHGPLYRFWLWRLGPQRHVLLLAFHHLLVDVLSLDILMRELGEAYAALRQGQQPALSPVRLDFSDVAEWQRTPVVHALEDRQLEYWREQLAGAPRLLQLPTDRARPPVLSDKGGTAARHRLSPALTQALGALCRQHQVTPFMALYAAFAALLHRYSGQEDFCVGTPVASRTHPATDDVVGLFVNSVVLRSRLQPSASFASLLSQTRSTALEAFAHQDVPFEKVVSHLGVERSLSHSPLFQVFFAWNRVDHSLAGALPGLAARPLHLPASAAKFDLAVMVSEDGPHLDVEAEYSTELFDASTVQRLLGHYLQLLEHALRAPDTRLDSLSLLSEDERRFVLHACNETHRPLEAQATVVSLLSEHARRTPRKVALAFEGGQWTYAGLEAHLHQVAHRLVAQGVGPESVVALVGPRTEATVRAVLSIHKAGAAFLPLEARLPPARIAQVLEESRAPFALALGGADALLAQALELLPASRRPRLLSLAGWEAESPETLARRDSSDGLAYVLFTSGSTGVPKGVMVHQRGMLNHILGMQQALGLGSEDLIAQTAALSFDISVWQMLAAFALGATTWLLEDEVVREPVRLASALEASGVTTVQLVPSVLQAMLEDGGARTPPSFERLKRMVTIGEALPPEVCRAWFARYPRIPLHNAYGPAECSDTATLHAMHTAPTRSSTPIGVPKANMRVYVLDEALHPVPAGVVGELYIGGEGVGRGYLNRPELTAERFLPDPYSGVPGARLYRTGDLGRRLANGLLEFVSRTDFQVKVRGMRIELPEIESALRRLPAVRSAVVMARERRPGDKYLAAFVVPAEAGTSEASLRESLARTLPGYMVPSRIALLEALPLSPNGKVDRKALAALPLEEAARAPVGEPPRGLVEELLAQLFCQVLGLEKVHREDDFFQLGGHSLSATRLVARVRQSLGVELPLGALFASTTVAGLAREVIRRQDGAATLPAPTPLPAGSPLVLSSAQERLWFEQQLQPGSSAYHTPEAVELKGPVDTDALEDALRWLLARHTVLRLVLPARDGSPVPSPHPVPPRALRHEPLSGHPDDRERLTRRLHEEVDRPFDLEHGPLYRFWLWRLGPEHHVLLVVFHHLLVDGLSLDLLMRELGEAYAAFRQGQRPSLPPVRLGYSDVAAWQRTGPVRAREDAQLEYWKHHLAGVPGLLQLPTDKPRPAVATHRGGITGLQPLPPELARALQSFCRQHQVTPYMVLYAAFATLLHRYSGQEDFCIGTPVSGRTHPATEDVVGLLVNTLVLYTRVEPSDSFASLLARVRTTTLEAIAHQDVPFERLVRTLGVERSTSHTPLFQVMFDLIRGEHTLADVFPGLQAHPVLMASHDSAFNLSLSVFERGEGYSLAIRYSAELFEARTALRMLGHYHQLLAQALRAPDTRVDALPLLTDEERRQLLVEWNDTRADFPRDTSLHALIEAQVARTPEALAVVSGEGRLTYRELDGRANQLARYLRRLGVGPEVRVGVCAERSLEMVVGLLGVLKAGGAYVPVEPSLPRERLAFMLEDSAVPVLLLQERLRGVLPERTPRCVSLDTGWEEIARESDAPVPGGATAENLAYAIYTSGSTGRPKLALNGHRAIVNRLVWMQDTYRLTAGDVVLQKTPYSFDVSVWELFWPLLTGARLVMARPDGHKDPAYLRRVIQEHGVTTLHFVPSMLQAFIDEPGLEACTSPRRIICSGEALPPALKEQVLARLQVELHNLYGPTEAAVDVSAWACARGDGLDVVPIGRPISNTRLHVLDARMQPVPVGVHGELYIGGVAVGRGYHASPDLTAERFVPDPFSAEPGARLYRTGDRVRHLPDGSIDFLGRIDFQVKLRGNRIELGEIEAVLGRHPAVGEAAVVVREDSPGDKRLVAFVVPRNEPVMADEVRAWLQRSLPEYMVPAALVSLERMPVSSNGKLDRKTLASLPVDKAAAPAGEPPRGPVEELLAQLFRQVLNVEQVRREDNFFHLGGHSLSATRLVARVRQSLGIELPLSTVFGSPTVAGLARAVEGARGSGRQELPSPSPRPAGSPPVLSFSQERLWFLQQLQPDSSAYHMTEAAELEGALDSGALEESLRLLLSRHSVLRTTFSAREGHPLPLVRPLPSQVLQHESLAELSEPESLALLQARLRQEVDRPFHLEHGPLYRFWLWRLGPQRHVLLLTFHHLLADGLSLAILMRELGEAYAALRQGQQPALSPVRLDHADVAAWQRTPAFQAVERRQLEYWREQLADAPRLLQLPTDRPRPPVLSDKGGTAARHRLPPALTQALGALCRQHQVTPFMALYAAFAALLHRYSGQEDFCVGTPVGGRTHPATDDVVGLFVNSVVLRSRLAPSAPFSSLLSQTRSTALEAFAHQDVPFEKVVSHLGVERGPSHAPLFQVAFTWNRIDVSLDGALPGLTSRPVYLPVTSTKVDLALVIREEGSGLEVEAEYNAGLFDASTVQRLLGHYLQLLEHALRAPDTRLDSLSFLSDEERESVVRSFNATHRPFDTRATTVSLFDAQVARAPEATALVARDGTLSYRELDERATALARYLAARGAGPETVIGVCLERTTELLVSLLAIHKAGAAYLPLESTHPLTRRTALLRHAGARLVVTRPGSFPEELPGLTQVTPDDRGPALPLRRPEPEHLALVLFTSGTTGEPKAVEVIHRNLVHLFEAADTSYPTRAGDTVLSATSVVFDVHVVEQLHPLTRGATVVLRETGPLELARDIVRHRATHLLATPSVITTALEEPGAAEAFQGLSLLQLGGEAPPESLVQRLSGGRARLLNGYGPSETTCITTLHPLQPGTPIRLGRPLDRVRLYVLDTLGQPTAPGVPGELYIGGEGVSRGYRGRPELTAERFVPDPFSGEPGARLYRTGDRVRWNADGTLSFLGRTDLQVKVRGVRIELEEVEAALLRQSGVRQAAVLARKNERETRLEAFITHEGDAAHAEQTLRESLAAVLPGAMVPSRIAVLDTLPLTPTGKVDRKALAALPMAGPAPRPAGEPPRGSTEELVAGLFRRLLGTEHVGRDGHFFELGGHSLSAVQLVAQLRRAFGVELPLSTVFAEPTVAGLAARLGTAPRRQVEPRPASPRPERVPASLVQERLWYALQRPKAPPYTMALALELVGPLDAAKLEAALTAVLERNETLRSTFLQEGETIFARTGPVTGPVLARTDLSHLPPEQVLTAARTIATRHDHQPFDVSNGPLYRFELLRLDTAGTRHVLVAAVSHLVVDGLGLQALIEEVAAAYRAALANEPALLPPASVQYADFALWQREPEHLRQVDESLESWKQALAHAPEVLDLPLDFPRRAPALNANMRPVKLSLRAGDVVTLRALARSEGVSTFTAVLALMQAWLHRLSAQGHVVVASPFSGRTLPQTEHLVGYFTNVLPLCTNVSGEPSFRELLKRAHGVVAHATAHQEVPFKRIADAVQPDADRTAPPLAQALLLLDAIHFPAFEGLSISDLAAEGVIPAYDVVLHLVEKPGGVMEGDLATDSELFTRTTSERMARAFEQLLAEAVREPDLPVSRLSLLSAEQRAQVLAALDGGTQTVPTGACVHTPFEAQVRRTPDAPAVAHGTTTWSYAELNARANLLAARLLSQGLRPEERVGVMMEPSAQGLAVLLGILKAGGTYVPLDPGWPEPRKRTVLERAGVRRLWVDAAMMEAHSDYAPVVEVPEQPERVPEDLGPGPRTVSDAQVAYIVFTSGSTGEPKGVMVEHRSVVNHNLAIAARFGLRAGDRMLQFAPLSFDAAAEDLYPPLAVGATVVMRSGLVPAHTMTPYLEQEDITIISLPPTYIEEWIRQMEALGQRVPPRLRLLAPGGDVLKRETFEAWRGVGGEHAPWVNVYGPTECTITSATCAIPGAEGVGADATFPIGRPIPRVRFYLLDEHFEPVLPGLPGRVYIGGAALSRGYLGAPHQTAERFLPDPFSTEPGARMYHTGDLARLQPDGRLRFLGRSDHQVKIRGFRIELSEIEACLRRFPEVEEAVVLARTGATGTQQLCAYVQAPASVKVEALRAHVAALLPTYMVPAAFVLLEKLPINNNGKVDRHALPDPDAVAPAPEPTPAAEQPAQKLETPFRSTLEMRLQRLWSEVLRQPSIKAEDNFFELGGDSLLAMRLLGRMEEEFGLPVPLATLFQYPVLKDTADALQGLLEMEPGQSNLVRLCGPETPAEAPAVFLFHPGDGELHHYRYLAPLLEPRFRSFGLQAPEAMSGRTFASFDERIAAYVKDIQTVQPHGPYRLIGYSYGGYPALGVAAALEAAGERVELLAMLDTLTFDTIDAIAPTRVDPALLVAEEFTVLDEELKRELAPLSPEAKWDLVAARARAKGTAASHFEGKDLARLWRILGEVLVPQVRGWKVPSVRAKLLLFRAESSAAQDETLGWGKHLPREQLEVVTLPGGHFSALQKPGVDSLVERLLALL
ncbi:non-ribosomal peptide synthetase [Archangium lipolyticum]|uniref:non-ribosomal peptide synthetase n=1 Tax=Archangium lipolyticum TaxID=2970465 RepID=UPI00214A1DDF|nr:non-ribosomal peptide synthetase [Archangium lipolyticum]